jgi:hypothetical protein
VVVRDHRRRGEVAPAEFYCYLEERVPRYSEFRREGNFLESIRPGFAPAVFKIHRAPSSNRLFCSGGIIFTQSTTWVYCSAGNPPPGGNLGLKCTQTDDILKKFKF